MNREHRERKFFLGAFVGGTLGALTAMMLTSKKGKEIQKELIKKYNHFERKAKRYAVSKKNELSSQVKKIAGETEKKIKRASRKVRKKIKKMKEDL